MNTLGLIPLEEGVSKRGTRGHDKDAARVRKERKKARKQAAKNKKKENDK